MIRDIIQLCLKDQMICTKYSNCLKQQIFDIAVHDVDMNLVDRSATYNIQPVYRQPLRQPHAHVPCLPFLVTFIALLRISIDSAAISQLSDIHYILDIS